MRSNLGVRVCEDRRKDKNGRARRELDGKLAVPQYQMPPFGWVEVSNRGDGTKAKGKVGNVHVWETDDSGTQVIRGGGENAIEWFAK